MKPFYSLGLDFGTNSVRALIVDVSNGKELATAIHHYTTGKKGVILSRNPNLARQHPGEWVKGAEMSIRKALAQAKKRVKGFKPERIIGIGIDATASTPLPVDEHGKPLAFHKPFAKDPDAMAWLWKDHTAVKEAEEITELARSIRPQYLAKCGGVYSSEWFFSKILHCIRTNPAVTDKAFMWIESVDWIPAVLTGTEAPGDLTVGICAAGHKAMFNELWGGYPDHDFLEQLHPRLAEFGSRMPSHVRTADRSVGGLTKAWAKKTGLKEGTPVAVGVIDAHMGAVGAGVATGTLVKIIGTSTCDIAVSPSDYPLEDIPGLCGIVDGSVLPGHFGLEAGQSAVGDIFNWFVEYIRPDGKKGTHEALALEAAKLRPGESGLLALDWNNGNRTVLVDQKLTGLLIGQTLYTTPAEIYRALVEATAFGALTIIRRIEEYGVPVEHVVNCGGIADKNPFVMQTYADVLGRPMNVSRSSQTCALGAAIAGAVVAGSKQGGYDSFTDAQAAMTGLKDMVYEPNKEAHAVYQQLYELYKTLHDAFGTDEWQGNLGGVMKELIRIRNGVKGI
ncbi:MAG: ribulokinase [Bacteroidia bacterium]|nr:MAG: ribulokinase [Bacteroidia bacterium]